MSTREVTVRIAPVAGSAEPTSRVPRGGARATYSAGVRGQRDGGIALHSFAEMLRIKYSLRRAGA